MSSTSEEVEPSTDPEIVQVYRVAGVAQGKAIKEFFSANREPAVAYADATIKQAVEAGDSSAHLVLDVLVGTQEMGREHFYSWPHAGLGRLA